MNRKVSVAPMMDCTERQKRFFLRLISKNTLLYTEMIVDEAINRGDKKKLLEFNINEKPVALQLGGSSPNLLSSPKLRRANLTLPPNPIASSSSHNNAVNSNSNSKFPILSIHPTQRIISVVHQFMPRSKYNSQLISSRFLV